MIYIPVIISELFIFTYWILNIGGKSMSDHTLNIILAVAAIIGPIITLIIARKSQISKNTEEIKKLARQLGVNDEKTFHAEFSEQYNDILYEIQNSIGKTSNDKALTGQHNDLINILQKDFQTIKSRYDKEDESYRSFTSQQKDLKETLDNFSKDYAKVIGYNQRLNYENCELKQKCDDLLSENQELKSQLGITSPNNSDSRK